MSDPQIAIQLHWIADAICSEGHWIFWGLIVGAWILGLLKSER